MSLSRTGKHGAIARRGLLAGRQLALIPEVDRASWTPDEWATPWDLVHGLEREFGAFDLDPAAQPGNAKAPRYFTPEQDGLRRKWDGRVFLNPPFSQVDAWLRKVITEVPHCEVIVCVLPVRTDRGWWHELVDGPADVRWIRGRQRFIGPDGRTVGRPSFSSCIAVYRGRWPGFDRRG